MEAGSVVCNIGRRIAGIWLAAELKAAEFGLLDVGQGR
jgi:hypothetical protein